MYQLATLISFLFPEELLRILCFGKTATDIHTQLVFVHGYEDAAWDLYFICKYSSVLSDVLLSSKETTAV